MATQTDPSLKGSSIYQIFVRNFSPEGTLIAAQAELPRIQAMGFDIVYLTPIHPIGLAARKGSVGSPYAIMDYRAVNPDIGTANDLRAFARACHSLGMKLIIDVVYNHSSPDSVLAKEHPDWFIRGKDGKPGRKVDDWSDVVDLDFSVPAMRRYLIDTLLYWLEHGVDGFRCDVASLVPVDFWLEARAACDAIQPTLWLAESVHKEFVTAMRALGHYAACDAEIHEAFDLSYDYDGRQQLEDAFSGQGRISEYLAHVQLQSSMYPSHAIKARCLENHDQRRIASVIPDLDRLKNWALLCMLLPGTFFAYMGQEWAIDHTPSLFECDPMPRPCRNADCGSVDDFESWWITAHRASKAIRARATSFCAREVAIGVVQLEIKLADGSIAVAVLNLDGRRGLLKLHSSAVPSLHGMDILSGEALSLSGSVELGPKPILLMHPKAS